MMHHTDPGMPLDETLRFLADAQASGKIRYWAWSNTTGGLTAAICAAAQRLGMSAPAAISVQYSLLCRETEWDILPAAAAERLAVLPWSPLKGGWLTGKAGAGAGGAEPPAGSRLAVAEASGRSKESAPTWSEFRDQTRTEATLAALHSVAARLRGTVAQVALRWLLHRRAVTAVVIGAKTVAQLEENLGALSITLSREDVALLDSSSAVAVPDPYKIVVGKVQAGRERDSSEGPMSYKD